jgi:sporulation protein YlmC with PRC-barrel domain
VLSTTYVGQTVFNNADENVGSISDLAFSKDGGVSTAIIGVGGFLGIGQKNVGVNFNSIQIIDDPDSADVRLVIDATREQLEEAPEYFTLEQQIAEEQANQPADTTAPMAPAPAPVQ